MFKVSASLPSLELVSLSSHRAAALSAISLAFLLQFPAL